ncbi:MAG: hypothetical protein ACE5G9_10035 [Nitrospinales bacterium]
MNRIKSGIKTTEFWTTVVAGVIMVFNQGLGIQLPSEQIMSLAGVVIAYILGRSIVKK